MIREIRNVRQVRGEARRRWFTDEYWDIYVWFDDDDKPVGFQLCYGKPDNEKALTWFDGRQPVHSGVSTGERDGGEGYAPSAPILVSDGKFGGKPVEERFLRDSAEIDETIRSYLIGKLADLDRPL